MHHIKTQTLAKRVLVLATSLLLVPTLALAVPGQVTQQGRLVDANGDGLTGSHTISFSLFSDAAGTTSVWSEQHAVEVDEGYYSVVLGADSSNLLDDTVLSLAPLYLGMTVDGGTLMQPLLEVNSAPYSILSGTAENLDGGYVDASSLYIEGDLVIDGNGDWVGNALPGSLASLGCVDGEEARYTAASGWECIDPGSHYTGAQAISAMGAEANTNPLNHARYTDAEAVTAVGAHTTDTQLDEAAVDAFVANNGYSTGNHTTQLDEAAVDAFVANNGYLSNTGDRISATNPTLELDDIIDGGADWAIRAAGEDFELFEPEDGDKVALSVLDGSGAAAKVILSPEGVAALTASGDGNVAVGGSGTGNRTLTVRADTNSIASIEAYGFGGNQGSGQLYAGQSELHGGGIMYNGDGTPTMEGQTDRISFFRRSDGVDTEVMKFPHNSDTVTFTGDVQITGDVRSACPSNMQRIGDMCIDVVQNAGADWFAAVTTCHNEGKRLCPLETIMACDALNADSGVSTSDCHDITDGSASNRTWTSTLAGYTTGAFEGFSQILRYEGDNDVDARDHAESNAYFCCTQAWGG